MYIKTANHYDYNATRWDDNFKHIFLQNTKVTNIVNQVDPWSEETEMRFENVLIGDRFMFSGNMYVKTTLYFTDCNSNATRTEDGFLGVFQRHTPVELLKRENTKEKVFYEVVVDHMMGPKYESIKDAQEAIKKRTDVDKDKFYIMKAIMKYQKPERDNRGFEELEE
jgi:hypothetical protein